MRKILFIAAVVLWAGACSSEETAPVEVEEEALEEEVVTTTSGQIVISPVFTKVSDTAFDEGDEIGVTITKSDGTAYTTNTDLTYSGSTFSGELTWYDGEETCDITAYYPYQSDGVPTTFEVQSDQSAGTSDSDFIVGSATNVSPSSEAVSIDFYHLLSRVNVNVTNNSGTDISSVTLAGSYLSATVDVAEQTVKVDDSGETGTITLYEATEGSVYQAIVVPQTVELTLTITMKDGIVKEKTLESKDLNSKSEYDVNVTISEYETWYVTNDSRTFPYDNSYCYGAQNTYYVEQYASESNSITFEVKARVSDDSYATGESPVVSVPKYYKIIIAGDDNSYTLLSIDNADDDGYVEVSSTYTITVNVASQNSDSGSWGVVGIYDESYNCLWTFMICKFLTGDDVSSITYTDIGKSIMDRHLGYGVSIAKAIEDGAGQTHGTAYFQYGRPTPFPYNNVNSLYSRAALSTDTDFAEAMKNPTTVYVANSQGNNYYNWHYSETSTESLWGGGKTSSNSSYDSTPTSTASKTIYDPCPEGYRVPDEDFFYLLTEKGDTLHCESAYDTYSYLTKTSESSPLSNQSVYRYCYGGSNYDYWPYTGLITNGNSSSDSYTTNRYGNLYGAIAYWDCNYYSVQYAGCLLRYNASSTVGKNYIYYKTRGMAVRCQLED